MKKDIKKLQKKYPDRLTVDIVGTTADNRNIYSITLGNKNAKKKTLVVAGMHAREYINCQVAMAMLERYCRRYKIGKSRGWSYKHILRENAIVFVPMLNPDGVTISQYGTKYIKDKKLRKLIRRVKKEGGKYKYWKANARGVDINRNFSGNWGHRCKHHPRSEGYCGKEPFSEVESQVFRRLVNNLKPKAIINLHSMGRMVYWGYHGKKTGKKEKKLTRIVFGQTHYESACENKTKGYGNAEHWLKNHHKIYVTIENGKSRCPVLHKEIYSVFRKNKNIPIMAARRF